MTWPHCHGSRLMDAPELGVCPEGSSRQEHVEPENKARLVAPCRSSEKHLSRTRAPLVTGGTAQSSGSTGRAGYGRSGAWVPVRRHGARRGDRVDRTGHRPRVSPVSVARASRCFWVPFERGIARCVGRGSGRVCHQLPPSCGPGPCTERPLPWTVPTRRLSLQGRGTWRRQRLASFWAFSLFFIHSSALNWRLLCQTRCQGVIKSQTISVFYEVL